MDEETFRRLIRRQYRFPQLLSMCLVVALMLALVLSHEHQPVRTRMLTKDHVPLFSIYGPHSVALSLIGSNLAEGRMDDEGELQAEEGFGFYVIANGSPIHGYFASGVSLKLEKPGIYTIFLCQTGGRGYIFQLDIIVGKPAPPEPSTGIQAYQKAPADAGAFALFLE